MHSAASLTILEPLLNFGSNKTRRQHKTFIAKNNLQVTIKNGANLKDLNPDECVLFKGI